MMDALIFDFDGVLVDSEPVHLWAFAEVLATVGVTLGREEYFEHYLGFDDYTCLREAIRRHGAACGPGKLDELVAAKTRVLQAHLAESIPPIAGAVKLVRAAAGAGVPLAIASGGLRREIEIGVETIGLAGCFSVIVAAEDVRQTKPHPEAYRQAAELLGRRLEREIAPRRCVAVEDSPTGIASAKAAGMNVLAVHTSYPPDELHQADRVEADLSTVTLELLNTLVS
ncbi:MAG: HAD family phosphatase [Phycisphaerae bacterium]|nr:HAD family phosphatase [Phycisphaerae bacterium]